MTTRKPEVKTVDFDVKKADELLSCAVRLVGFPMYFGIREATDRQLAKMEEDLEEKLEKVHEEEAKEKAAAEAAKQREQAAAAKVAEPPPLVPAGADETKGGKR